MKSQGWVLIHHDWAPCKKRSGHRRREKTAVHEPRRETLGASDPASISILMASKL